MTPADETASEVVASEPKREKRSVAHLLKTCFRGWDLDTPAGRVRTVPNNGEIAHFVELGRSTGSFKQGELRFDSPEFHAAFKQYISDVGGDVNKCIRWAKDYHAARVAKIAVQGWSDYPIRIAANGDMIDGQHRLLSADFLGMTEVDVEVQG